MPSHRDRLLLAIGVGIVVHVIYNRFEPRKLRYHVGLLAGVPLALVVTLREASFAQTALYVYPIFFASLLCSVILYRLSPFHPLAKFPGPISHRTSNLWMVKNATGGRRHLYYRDLHEKYGPFVRVGPNDVSIVDSGAIYPMLGSKGIPRGEGHHMFNKDESEVNLTSTEDPHQHAAFRKVWNRGFTPSALRGYDPIFAKRVSQLVECLGKQQGALDLGKWISYYKFDFMGDLVFGGGFELMKAGGDPDGFWTIQNEGMKFGAPLLHTPWLGKFFLHMPMGSGASRQLEFGLRCVEKRLQTGSMTHDLFHYFAEEDKPEGQRPSIKRIMHDATTAIIAAADTTSTTMTAVFYHILRDLDAYKKLQAEVDRNFDRTEDITDHQKLAQMPFLNACIDETLRLVPALPTALNRTTPVGQGVDICGRFIPGGTTVTLPLYTLFRDSRYFFPIPDRFWPDRWLYKEDNEKAPASGFVLDTSAFIPFSFGPANCIGKQLAYKEMRYVIATILQKYDLRFADGYNPDRFMNELEDRFVFLKGELPVVLTMRS